MRRVTITAEEYNMFLFPHVGGSTIAKIEEQDTAVRLIAKLKDPGEEQELPQEQLEAVQRGQQIFPAYIMERGAECELNLEEDEAKMAVQKLQETIFRVPLAGLTEYKVLIEKIKNGKGG